MDEQQIIDAYIATGTEFGWAVHMIPLAGQCSGFGDLHHKLVELEAQYVGMGYRAIPLRQFEVLALPRMYEQLKIPINLLVRSHLKEGEEPTFPAAEYHGEPFVSKPWEDAYREYCQFVYR